MTKKVSIDKVYPDGSRYSVTKHGENSPRKDGELELKPNRFTFRKKKGNGRMYTYQADGKAPKYYYDGDRESILSGFNSIRFDDTSSPLVNNLVMELRNKIRDGDDFNLAVTFAERRETFGMITNSAKKLNKAAEQVLKNKHASACRTLGIPFRSPYIKHGRKSFRQSASDYWLAINYGWLPTISDMTGAMIAADKVRHRNPTYISRVKDGFETVEYLTKDAIWPPYNSVWKFTHRCTRDHMVSLKMEAWFKITSPTLKTADQLGLLNPGLVAWERVPFSFVVDWFIPVGDWIAQIPPLSGVKVEHCFLTVVESKRCELKGFHARNIPRKKDYYAQDLTIEQFSVVRKPHDLNAVLYPTWDAGMSAKRATSALALLSQTFDRMLKAKH